LEGINGNIIYSRGAYAPPLSMYFLIKNKIIRAKRAKQNSFILICFNGKEYF